MEYSLPKKPKIKEKTPAPDQRKFSVMPLSVINKRMTLASYRVLVVLSSYCNKAGFTYVSLARIGNDLGITAPSVSRQIQRLQKLGIVKKVSGHYSMIKGATRRIIYDDNLSNEDASRIANAPIEPYNNREIKGELMKKRISKSNKIAKEAKPVSAKQSNQLHNELLASVFECVKSEQDLVIVERRLASGENPADILKELQG
jgi:DNA-binding Lrp family transcriptional regulator